MIKLTKINYFLTVSSVMWVSLVACNALRRPL